MGNERDNPFNKEKLGTELLQEWQSLLNAVAEVFQVPAALITRLDKGEIEILVSSESKGNPYTSGAKAQFPNSNWYCERTLKSGSMLTIPNALKDTQWRDNPAVTGPHMISYAGLPIALPAGGLFGTICFLDNKEHFYNDSHKKLLYQFKKLIELNLRVIYDKEELAERDQLLDRLSKVYPICCNCKKIHAKTGEWVAVEEYLTRLTGKEATHGICPQCMEKLYPENHIK